MEKPKLGIFDGPDELAAAAARLVRNSAAEAIGQMGRFTMALAGGLTPERAYALLASSTGSDRLDWSRIWLLFGDERWVDHQDPRSNYKMVQDSLLVPAAVPDENVFAIPTALPTAHACARAYARIVSRLFGTSKGQAPSIDLVLLGLGEDGHTASLFPGAPALKVTNTPVTSTSPGTLPPPVDRITLTYPAINAARQVVFLVSGAIKAKAFADVWLERAPRNERPALGVRPQHGTLTWLVDRAAAAEIDEH